MPSHAIYLAGPEVFLPNAREVAEEKKALCASHGFDGLFPLDNEISADGLSPEAHAMAIARANEEMMRRADAMIANLTPYHGPSGDVGTAYEVGFMRALGKAIFAYTNSAVVFRERVDAFFSTRPVDGGPDAFGAASPEFMREDFQLSDNLMLEQAVFALTGSAMVRGSVAPGTELTDLTAFSRCLQLARGQLRDA